ncbi:hypothetical protein R1flu_004915 [Riccia fluitans]|uniref:Mediator complex subunit 15 KIX domain-containing protein n=1 Tax=Riccia fluitans TaxID=41844 RepID=A0ABD1YRN5_9MARC
MFEKEDWQSELKPESREANVMKIVSHLEKFIPTHDVESSLLKFSRNFEEHCCKTATSLREYQRKIKDEMASIEKYDKLCEENPFTNRKYEGFLGAIRMTYNSRTVAAPPGEFQRDPDDITLEQSAKTVLRRNANLKGAVRKLLLEKALKQGKGTSAFFNAVKGLGHQMERSEEKSQQSPSQSTTSSNQRDLQALNPFQKKNKIPGVSGPQ